VQAAESGRNEPFLGHGAILDLLIGKVDEVLDCFARCMHQVLHVEDDVELHLISLAPEIWVIRGFFVETDAPLLNPFPEQLSLPRVEGLNFVVENPGKPGVTGFRLLPSLEVDIGMARPRLAPLDSCLLGPRENPQAHCSVVEALVNRL
jgi:hypothetical protein